MSSHGDTKKPLSSCTEGPGRYMADISADLRQGCDTAQREPDTGDPEYRDDEHYGDDGISGTSHGDDLGKKSPHEKHEKDQKHRTGQDSHRGSAQQQKTADC